MNGWYVQPRTSVIYDPYFFSIIINSEPNPQLEDQIVSKLEPITHATCRSICKVNAQHNTLGDSPGECAWCPTTVLLALGGVLYSLIAGGYYVTCHGP